MHKARIVKPPMGDPPLWVREAWVGLELSVVSGARPKTYLVVGDINDPKTRFGALLYLLQGNGRRMTGYLVLAGSAVDLLAASTPDAARWWRQNAPHALHPGLKFLFNKDACSPLIDSQSSGTG